MSAVATQSSATAEAPALPAAGSSFYLGMRVLPKPRREAMYAIYAFCRAVDDIADDGGDRAERVVALDRWRSDIDALYAGEVRPSTAALAPHIAPYGLHRESFHEIIDGMAMDVAGDIQAPDWSTLDLYCDRVASAVGRLSARIFGLPSGEADLLAHHLGRALQLTNILRDIDEDAAINRLYLPREPMIARGMTDLTPAAVLAHPRLPEICLEVAEKARGYYDDASRVMDRQPGRLVRAPRLMEAAYGSVLNRMLKRGWAAPRRRVSTDKLRLLGAVLRYSLT
jgi:squalene synthase HpnD